MRVPRLAEIRRALFEDRAPVYFRLVFTGEPVDAGTADRAVDVALAAARARVLPTP